MCDDAGDESSRWCSRWESGHERIVSEWCRESDREEGKYSVNDTVSEWYSSIGVSCANQKSVRKYISTWQGLVWRWWVCEIAWWRLENYPYWDVPNMVIHVARFVWYSTVISLCYGTSEWVCWMRVGSVHERGECGSVTSGSTSGHSSTGGVMCDHGQTSFQRPPANTLPTSSMLYSCRG